MINTFILRNNLKSDSVRGWHYCIKFAVGILLLLFIYRVHFAAQTRMAGLLFFQLLAPAIYVIYSVACYIVFSNLVVRDRERGELDLLLITGIGKFAYLINVFISAWISIVNLLIVQVPLAMYAITFGGIHHAQIASFYVYLLVWLLFISMLGFCCGVIFSKVRESYLISFIVSLGVFFILLEAGIGGFHRIDDFLALGVTEVIYPDEIYYLLTLSFLLFVFSWIWFEKMDTIKLRFLSPFSKKIRTVVLVLSSGNASLGSAERVTVRFGSYPLLLKDMFLHPPLNAIFWNLPLVEYPKICFISLLVLLALAEQLIAGLLIIFVLTVLLHFNRFITCIASEVREGTLSGIMGLPMDTETIIEDKIHASQSYTALLKGIYWLLLISMVVVSILSVFDSLVIQLLLAVAFLPVLLKVLHYVCFIVIIFLPHANRGLYFGILVIVTAAYLLMPLVTGPIFVGCYYYLRYKLPNIMEHKIALLA